MFRWENLTSHLVRMKNSSYYIAPVGDWTHDLPHTVASNMVKVSHSLNHSATEAVTFMFSCWLISVHGNQQIGRHFNKNGQFEFKFHVHDNFFSCLIRRIGSLLCSTMLCHWLHRAQFFMQRISLSAWTLYLTSISRKHISPVCKWNISWYNCRIVIWFWEFQLHWVYAYNDYGNLLGICDWLKVASVINAEYFRFFFGFLVFENKYV